MYVYVPHTFLVSVEARKKVGSPGTGVAHTIIRCHMAPSNQTLILLKSSKPSFPLSLFSQPFTECFHWTLFLVFIFWRCCVDPKLLTFEIYLRTFYLPSQTYVSENHGTECMVPQGFDGFEDSDWPSIQSTRILSTKTLRLTASYHKYSVQPN